MGKRNGNKNANVHVQVNIRMIIAFWKLEIYQEVTHILSEFCTFLSGKS